MLSRTHISFFFQAAILVVAMLLSGCRGSTSSEPPIHIVANMDSQEKFEAQERNTFFADARAMRSPVDGTVSRSGLRADTRFFDGKNPDGSFVDRIPVPVTKELMLRGQERYDIFCTVCHGAVGDGLGVIMTGKYGFVPAPSYHSDLLRGQTDGYLYEVIAKGVRTMPSYAQQIDVEDRWAIVAYVRALQRSQYASTMDVPDNER